MIQFWSPQLSLLSYRPTPLLPLRVLLIPSSETSHPHAIANGALNTRLWGFVDVMSLLALRASTSAHFQSHNGWSPSLFLFGQRPGPLESARLVLDVHHLSRINPRI